MDRESVVGAPIVGVLLHLAQQNPEAKEDE